MEAYWIRSSAERYLNLCHYLHDVFPTRGCAPHPRTVCTSLWEHHVLYSSYFYAFVDPPHSWCSSGLLSRAGVRQNEGDPSPGRTMGMHCSVSDARPYVLGFVCVCVCVCFFHFVLFTVTNFQLPLLWVALMEIDGGRRNGELAVPSYIDTARFMYFFNTKY